ncbi:hypothetical protein D3C87_1082330 [compost metagenome]
MVEIERDTDQRRDQHPACGGRTGQQAAAPARQLAIEHLALDFQADQQEEQRH